MTHATLNKPAAIDFTEVDVHKLFADLAAELTAPKPEKLEWQATAAPVGIINAPSLETVNAYMEFAQAKAKIDAFIAIAEKPEPYFTQPTPPEVTDAECADAADAAAECIVRYGWTRGAYGDAKRGFCAAGALSHVTMTGNYRGAFRASHIFAAVMSRIQKHKRVGSIPDWNDARDRTADQVIGAFREAAASFRTP